MKFRPTSYLSRQILLNALAVVVSPGLPGILSAVRIGAYSGVVAPSPSLLLAALTEPGYTGYARSGVVVWGAPFVDPTGLSSIAGATVQFVASDGAVQATINGVFWVTGTGGGAILLGIDPFDNPVNIVNGGDGFAYVPSLSMPNANYGAGALVA